MKTSGSFGMENPRDPCPYPENPGDFRNNPDPGDSWNLSKIQKWGFSSLLFQKYRDFFGISGIPDIFQKSPGPESRRFMQESRGFLVILSFLVGWDFSTKCHHWFWPKSWRSFNFLKVYVFNKLSYNFNRILGRKCSRKKAPQKESSSVEYGSNYTSFFVKEFWQLSIFGD